MKLTTSEHQEQCLIFEWAYLNRFKYPCLNLMFAIPNGSHKSITQAVKFKREGLKSGVPDIFLPQPVPPYNGLFIELKAKNGKLSENQKYYLHNLKNQGYFTILCIGADHAIQIIENYLNGIQHNIKTKVK